ncbi:hypothetical protein QN219_04905 [Sinorhizobium sp. 7-81]|uniref:hypothetical protein n=1 Tax=Sinorhizobium sp. 8-89 TaxID=3049089 RepID=UPI0024C3EEDE|nr:hypothetical protein [Sinorhizobium sp. 8-89]MDK1489395.1 hypothetical protein [Sinorhizobium sp. 8-89]
MNLLGLTLTSIAVFGSLAISHAQSPAGEEQQALPVTSEERISKSRQLVMSINPHGLFGNILNIYKVSGEENLYNFLPYVIPEWNSFKTHYEKQCQDQQSVDDTKKTIRIPLSFYSNDLLDEIKRLIVLNSGKAGTNISLGIPPSVGIVAYAFDHENLPYEIINTIPLTDLLKGVPLTDVSSGFPKQLEGRVRATCFELAEIADSQRLTALMFIVGATAKVNKLAAAASTLVQSDLGAQLRNNETEVNRTTLTNKGKGAGIGVKLGGISIGGGSQQSQSTADTQHYRIINRTWLDSNIERATTGVLIDQICDSEVCKSDIVDQLFNHFFGHLEKERVIIQEQSADAWTAKYKMGGLSIQKITVSEELANTLKQAAEMNDKASGEYSGIKFTKEDADNLTAESGVTFKRSGDRWVPTSVDAYVVSLADLERSIELNFNQMILGESENVAIQLTPLVRPSEPSDSSEAAALRKSMEEAWSMWNETQQKNVPPPIPEYFQLGQRNAGAVYRNDKTDSILVIIDAKGKKSCALSLYVNNVLANSHSIQSLSDTGVVADCTVEAFVPPGATYQLVHRPPSKISRWREYTP